MNYGTTVNSFPSTMDTSYILTNSLTACTPHLLMQLLQSSKDLLKIKLAEVAHSKNSGLIKYTSLNVNFMPSSSPTGPVRACEILLHHCPSFNHNLGNSAAFPYLPLCPAKAKYSQIVTAQHFWKEKQTSSQKRKREREKKASTIPGKHCYGLLSFSRKAVLQRKTRMFINIKAPAAHCHNYEHNLTAAHTVSIHGLSIKAKLCQNTSS